jgi:hypothetical protein
MLPVLISDPEMRERVADTFTSQVQTSQHFFVAIVSATN